jgi:beta-glucosidase
VSLVENLDSYVPLTETPENIEAARRPFVSQEHNAVVLVPALTGSYNPQHWAELGAEVPDVQPGDLQTICQPLDALGMNIYTGSYVRAADNAHGYELLPLPRGYPQMHMPWLNFLPESLYWGVRLVGEALGKKDLPIYVSENGCASDDVVTGRGEVVDLDRILYMRAYLRSAQRAIADGYPLIGYFHWSLLDNFEWSCGYTRRFGLTHVDYATQKRIPKLSYHWYQRAIRENRVV